MEPNYMDIKGEASRNKHYRKIIYTVPNKMQIVLMSIPSGSEISEEVHPKTAQFIGIVKGLGVATVNGKHYALADGITITIPPGAKHRVQVIGKGPLKLYTIYGPPEHTTDSEWR